VDADRAALPTYTATLHARMSVAQIPQAPKYAANLWTVVFDVNTKASVFKGRIIHENQIHIFKNANQKTVNTVTIYPTMKLSV
jgi:hypothetical protein